MGPLPVVREEFLRNFRKKNKEKPASGWPCAWFSIDFKNERTCALLGVLASELSFVGQSPATKQKKCENLHVKLRN
jgi:hypothetical protein